ncbi:alpha/beta hydrolase [Methylocystis sp. MJC1]|jgi:lysophospholipase|uniref:alpha/beta fold hydrolase n=1 Tax=Methylocystis sp. MJC1 TaxID=2654282 RepID=UPI0013EA165D|nr:alpha/beta hydrolase [Methylocystis sp. MJC1]KAF2991737.1 Lysophospholipase L2 [Methylocystis sp. MJC1]MBU6527024.1 alpha/beta hydrolase [Methylocystis sp. MJC1]UZX13462.1 alpha/beta hydrolase [Methylocystis sp. MJC1]
MLELVATPDNPIPTGAIVQQLKTYDGRRLRAATFPCPTRPRGTVAVFQGHNEFIEKYFETIENLRERGFDVVALDWRGQAGSERELADPRKGHVDDFSQYQRDLDVFIAEVLSPRPQPWFALAHSMGGAIMVDLAHSSRPPFERIALIAPMIDLANLLFPRGARWLADTLDMLGLGGQFIPFGGGRNYLELPFEANKLTTDPIRFARNARIVAAAPQLVIGDPTIGWVNAAFRLMKRFEAPEYPRAIRTPILVFEAGRERIVSNAAMERFMQNLDTGALLTIAGAKHEILMERDELRGQFWQAFDAFIPGSGG